MPDQRLLGKTIHVVCGCGREDDLPAGAGGLTVQCPACGAQLRVPMFEAGPALSRQDVALVERLAGRRLRAPRRPRAPLLAASALALVVGGALYLLLTGQVLRLTTLLTSMLLAAALALAALRRPG